MNLRKYTEICELLEHFADCQANSYVLQQAVMLQVSRKCRRMMTACLYSMSAMRQSFPHVWEARLKQIERGN